MSRYEFLKRFGLLAAVAALISGCASPKGGDDDDDDTDEMREKHEGSQG